MCPGRERWRLPQGQRFRSARIELRHPMRGPEERLPAAGGLSFGLFDALEIGLLVEKEQLTDPGGILGGDNVGLVAERGSFSFSATRNRFSPSVMFSSTSAGVFVEFTEHGNGAIEVAFLFEVTAGE